MKTRDNRRGAAVIETAAPASPRRHRGVTLELDAFSVPGGPARSYVAAPSGPARRAFPSPVLGGGIPRATAGMFHFNDLPDGVLLGWLAGQGHRPNVLIETSPKTMDTAMRHLMTWCALPFRYCALPGRLELPTTQRGTLLLNDVAALTLSQQVALYDWLSLGLAGIQVVSLTSQPIAQRVEDGEFLEGLFYRLNIIRLDAAGGTRPAPLDTWQNAARTV